MLSLTILALTCETALRRIIPTGCSSLDRLLMGGLTAETLNLIYGEAETGKTTLTIQCAVNCGRMKLKTILVDCDGSFSTQRLIQIAPEDYEEIAEKIILAKPENFKQQSYLIDQLENLITEKVRLIAIDTVTSLYRAELAENSKKVFKLNRELNRQLAYLSQLAKTRKLIVLLTSQVRSVLQTEGVIVEPVATRVLKFWADTVINLKPTARPYVIKAVLEKHPEQKKLKKCFLKITPRGITTIDEQT